MLHAALIHAVVLATTPTKSKGGSSLGLLILPLLFVVGYFVLIRPARNRQRASLQQDLEQRKQIGVGEEIITTSGLIATIVAKTDDEVTLEIAPGVHARYVPAAIMRSRADDVEPEPEPDVSNHEVIEPDSSDSTSGESPTEVPPENPDEPPVN